MDYGLPGSTVHGIIPVRILEWVAISSSRGSSQPRDQTPSPVSPALAGGFFTTEPPGKPRHPQGLSKILHWPWSFLQAILISFLPEHLPTYLSYMVWLAGRLDLCATCLLCVQTASYWVASSLRQKHGLQFSSVQFSRVQLLATP